MHIRLIDKIKNRVRISEKEANQLYLLDFFTLGNLADSIRRERFSNKTFFNINRHINPTNVCIDTCKFCAYSSSRKNPNQYTMSHKKILEIAKNSFEKGATELHIVSAHNNQVGLDWYMDIFKKIKNQFPKIHIKALTAAEVHFLSEEHHLTYDEVIDLMIKNGVDSMPGGGAEIFDEKVRDFICKGKLSSTQWIEIHRRWHNRGVKSNATMLFGHIESRENRINHMIRLRNLQDETGGFNAFIPLIYQKENNFLKVSNFPTAQEILKTYAISRIVLDNILNIKAYWASATINLALVSQEFGTNDLDGTIEEEAIQSQAGANSKKGIELKTLKELISNSGFIPTERDSVYNLIK